MLKFFTYRILLVVLIMLPVVAVYGQNARNNFRDDISEAFGYIKSNPEKAIEKSEAAYRQAERDGDKWAMAMGQSGMGYIAYKLRDYKAAFANYHAAKEGLDNSDTTDVYNKIDVFRHLSMIHSKFRNHEVSIQYRERALDMAKIYLAEFPEHAEKYKKQTIVTDIIYFLAAEHEKKGASQTAGKILMDLWEEAESKNDVVSYARVLNKLGIIKKKNGEYTDALEYFSLVIAAKGVSKKYKSIAYHNLAETYMVQGNYSKAEGFYSIALGLKEDLGNARSTFITYLGMGELAYKKNQVTEAISHWETALSIFSKVDADPDLYVIYNWLQLAYMDVDIARAKEFNAEYVKLIDFHNRSRSIQNEEDANQREALSLLIDQQKQNRVDAAERKQFVRQFWPVFLGVALLVLFSMVLGFRYYMALRANKLLTKGLLQPQQAQIHGASLVSEKD